MDLTGDLSSHSEKECRYVEMQTRVSKYFSEKVVAKTTTPQQVMTTIEELKNENEGLKKRVEELEFRKVAGDKVQEE